MPDSIGPEKGCIVVLPIGKVPESALDAVSDSISLYFNHHTRILSPLRTPQCAFDEQRRQYNAATIIRTLESINFEDDAKVVAIVNVDLFIPIFTHVMGEAQEGGKFALVSMYRLMKGGVGNRPSTSKILKRLAKVALHELGHLFDVVHCADEKCIMHFAGNIQDIDHIMLNFCTYCERYLEESMKRHLKPTSLCSHHPELT